VLRMLARAYFGPVNEKWADLKEMRIGEQAAGVLLVAMILFMGLWPDPFIDRISQTVEVIPGIT
jgi:NADH:ubiquinone oxidoreductase subunit 4 (subunit M)